MFVDQGSQLTSTRWERRARAVGIDLKIYGIDCQNYLGLGERYHSPLRRVYENIRHEQRRLICTMALRIAQKAVNSTMGPCGHFQSLLVYVILP